MAAEVRYAAAVPGLHSFVREQLAVATFPSPMTVTSSTQFAMSAACLMPRHAAFASSGCLRLGRNRHPPSSTPSSLVATIQPDLTSGMYLLVQ